MTTFIKAKLKKADVPMNNDKYRVAANITEYLIKINLTKIHHSKIHDDQAIISCKKRNVKISKIIMFKMGSWTVSGILITILKSIKQI